MSDDLVKRLREGDHFEKVMSAGQAADRIEQLERETQLQAQEIDKTRLRADKWQSMVLDCEKYLKPGETPRQRMDRDHADVLGLIKLLETEKRKSERLEAELREAVEALRFYAEGEWPEDYPGGVLFAAGDDTPDFKTHIDYGDKARKTIAELAGEER